MRILITGGAGFIGSHVTDAYLAAGHEVAVVDDLSSGSADNVDPRARWYRMDVRDPGLDAAFAEERPEIVCHHAAQVSVSTAQRTSENRAHQCGERDTAPTLITPDQERAQAEQNESHQPP